MKDDIKEILVTQEEIQEICKRLGKQLTMDYAGKKPLMIGLLKGCHPFMSDLSKEIDTMIELDYMDVSSYHGTTASTGDVKIRLDLSVSVKGRDVIIAEDIVDTARTIKTISELLLYKEAKSVKVVSLLDKPEGRVVDFTVDYVGKTIPKAFVVGYGLDYEEYYRNLPYVGVLKESVYSKEDK